MPPVWRKIALLSLAALGLAAAWRYTPLSEIVTRENVAGWAEAVRAAPWAPFALVLAYTPAAIVMFPRPLLTLVAVVAFGVWFGVACAVAGVMGAALATYFAGRFFDPGTVRRLGGKASEPAIRVLRNHGVLAIFALNMVPAPPFVVQGMIAGAIRMNVWHYALGSLLGLAPTVLAWTVFGEQISRALKDASNVSWWMVAAAILVVAALTYFVRQWFARQAAAEAAPA